MPKIKGRHEKVWRCTCHGAHFLAISWYDDDDAAFLQLEGNFRTTGWQRLKYLWAMLRHGHADSWIEVALDDGDTAREIAATLTEWADWHKGDGDDQDR